MSRPRKPTALLEASGAFRKNPARRRARLNEPEGTGPIGEPPEWLNAGERECWRELVADAVPGVLTRSDNNFVALLASLYAKVKARKVSAAIYVQFRRGLSELGLTPTGRASMHVPAKPLPNPFAEI